MYSDLSSCMRILVLAVQLMWQVDGSIFIPILKKETWYEKARDDLKVAASGTKPGIEGHAQT